MCDDHPRTLCAHQASHVRQAGSCLPAEDARIVPPLGRHTGGTTTTNSRSPESLLLQRPAAAYDATTSGPAATTHQAEGHVFQYLFAASATKSHASGQL